MNRARLGIDEVGRGPWAGPLVVGAVILGDDFAKLPEYEELRDSKKLSAKKREKLASIINEKALATGLGWVSAAELDQIGMSKALRLAARKAVKNLLTTYKPERLEIIIDGVINLLADTPLAKNVTLIPKGDNLVKEVSAASIIAKVARDAYMTEVDAKYPGYGFARHVGYGTAAHKAALERLGPCPEHRLSFRPVAAIAVKNHDGRQLAKPRKNTTAIGRATEQLVAERLQKDGHKIIAQNYKTKLYELDIISVKDNFIYFTEVKHRQHINPAEAIVPEKLHHAAELFLNDHKEYTSYESLLAIADDETWMKIAP